MSTYSRLRSMSLNVSLSTSRSLVGLGILFLKIHAQTVSYRLTALLMFGVGCRQSSRLLVQPDPSPPLGVVCCRARSSRLARRADLVDALDADAPES